jgi:hypothetical protein
MKTTNGKVKTNAMTAAGMVAGWAKFAPVLVAVRQMAEAVEQFRADPDAAGLLADDDVAYELRQLAKIARESAGLVAEYAAGAMVR